MDAKTAMPSVFDGEMRQTIFAKQAFTDEFEAVGGLFYGQCAEYCGNSHAYMSFRALAQTDEDFDKWVLKFRNAPKPNLQPTAYSAENTYDVGTVVTFPDEKLGENNRSEFRALKAIAKSQTPVTKPDIWEKVHSDDYEKKENPFWDTRLCSVPRYQQNRNWCKRSQPNSLWLTHIACSWLDEKRRRQSR